MSPRTPYRVIDVRVELQGTWLGNTYPLNSDTNMALMNTDIIYVFMHFYGYAVMLGDCISWQDYSLAKQHRVTTVGKITWHLSLEPALKLVLV